MSTLIRDYLLGLGLEQGPPGEDEVRIIRHCDGEVTERLIIGALAPDGTVFRTEISVEDDDVETHPIFLADCAMRHFYERYAGLAEWPIAAWRVAVSREGRC